MTNNQLKQAIKKAKRNPLLADDMGSGKTPQAIVTYLLMLEQGLVHRLLVVCPKNVLWNWVYEFKKVMHPDILLNAVVYHGYARKKTNLSTADIVLITYETLRNDIDKFKTIRWGLIILDEIHQIRNIDTSKSGAIMELQGDYFMGLSGTPIVNSLADIHTIMKRLNPSILGPRSKFDSEFASGSGWGGTRKYIESSWAYESIKEKISAVMIRRDPEIILKDLPEFHRIHRWVSLDDTVQGKNYDALLEEGRLEWEDIKSGKIKTIEVRSHILALFTRLKQQVNVDFATGQSAKIDYIEEMLDEEIMVDDVNRVVIFSQYIKQGLDHLERRLQKWNPLRIDGSVDAELRQKRADLFNDPTSPHRVLLGQITAAGEGINLDGGNFAILFDLWWNEAKHQQAFKRIRRMTQKRQQHFIIVCTENTIENKILDIIEKKNKAFVGVIEGQADASSFSMDDFEEAMFGSGFTQSKSTKKEKKNILLI